MGSVYGLPRHVFDEERIERWAERRGALVKSIEDAALGMASVYRAIGLPLPERMPIARDDTLRAFQQLLAQFMPFTLVIDEQTADGRRSARLEDERVRQLGADHRRAALLRRQVRESARVDRGHADSVRRCCGRSRR